VTEPEIQRVLRENDDLKLRCARLQDDVTDLSSQLNRVRRQLERLHGVRVVPSANPLPKGH
jgi:hypothetical protein